MMIPQVLSILQVFFAPSERAGVLDVFGAVNGAPAVRPDRGSPGYRRGGVVFFGVIGTDFSSGNVRETLLLSLRAPFISLHIAAGASLLLASAAAIRDQVAAADAAI